MARRRSAKHEATSDVIKYIQQLAKYAAAEHGNTEIMNKNTSTLSITNTVTWKHDIAPQRII